jgi:predicted ATPase
MLGVAPGEVGDALDAAIAAGFIHELGAGRYSFVHTLDREAIYMRVGPARRSALHRRAANAIAEVQGGDAWPAAAEIALHLCSSGDEPSAAIEAASAAAEEAIDKAAYGLAVLLLTRALALVPEGDREGRRKLTVRRAVAHQHEFHVYVDARQLSG